MTAESSAHNVGFRCAAEWEDPAGAQPWLDDADLEAAEEEEEGEEGADDSGRSTSM